MNTKELLRQSLHLLIGTGIIILYVKNILVLPLTLLFLFLTLLGLFIIQLTNMFGLRTLVDKLERKKSYLPLWGVISLLKGLAIIQLFFSKELGTYLLIIVVFGDALSTIIGKQAHNKLFWNKNKSYAGTIAGIIISTLLLQCLLPLWEGLLIASIGMLVESMKKPLWFDDNLAIPLLTGIIISILAILL